jgi:hypothetical protein
VLLSALARTDGGEIANVERALYEDRALLRVLAMRRTMFVAPVDTTGVLLAACSQDVAARERKRLVGFLQAPPTTSTAGSPPPSRPPSRASPRAGRPPPRRSLAGRSAVAFHAMQRLARLDRRVLLPREAVA